MNSTMAERAAVEDAGDFDYADKMLNVSGSAGLLRGLSIRSARTQCPEHEER